MPKLLLEEAQAHPELKRQASVHRISRAWIILNPLIFIVESFNVRGTKPVVINTQVVKALQRKALSILNLSSRVFEQAQIRQLPAYPSRAHVPNQ